MYMYVINLCCHGIIRKCRSLLTHHRELLKHEEDCQTVEKHLEELAEWDMVKQTCDPGRQGPARST